ncbi:DnaJ domain-containing protein [Phaeosphaeriaceae sp. PMI808]|nr:DnaJ domain-containing protein [Phaeosphaeriaceae sp. PMI808]
MAERDYYADLNLTRHANTSEIKSAYHALARQHHPDRTGSNDSTAFHRVQMAYMNLSDPKLREKYDKTYMSTRMHIQSDNGLSGSRTEQYEALEVEREVREKKALTNDALQLMKSPLPNVFGTTAHELNVRMTSHPSTTQRCALRTWKVQSGTDICIFCLAATASGNRCLGCEALACPACLAQIRTKEMSNPFATLSN